MAVGVEHDPERVGAELGEAVHASGGVRRGGLDVELVAEAGRRVRRAGRAASWTLPNRSTHSTSASSRRVPLATGRRQAHQVAGLDAVTEIAERRPCHRPRRGRGEDVAAVERGTVQRRRPPAARRLPDPAEGVDGPRAADRCRGRRRHRAGARRRCDPAEMAARVAATARRAVPTPGSTTPSTTPGPRWVTARTAPARPPRTSKAATPWVRSTTGAPGRGGTRRLAPLRRTRRRTRSRSARTPTPGRRPRRPAPLAEAVGRGQPAWVYRSAR